MPRNGEEAPAVRVYTVCDESRYLIVKNVPALGCGDELGKLFRSYGEIEECKPMDEEECEAYTDVYWIKFVQVSNARFAKRKLDEFIFLGNRLQVSYAPQFECLSDTKDKLECRRKEILARLNSGRPKAQNSDAMFEALVAPAPSQTNCIAPQMTSKQREYVGSETYYHTNNTSIVTKVSSTKEYFSSPSMNKTVHLVREKLDKIQSSGKQLESGPALKKTRVDNRRRI
ncbi:hypothetical protein GIB67_004344 [Kingdonia uniflora]|uniref:RNA-binding protein 48 n=1 Tax=Kingdonia uniflora TaxID=39325 RepID=A0A7J7MR96_9MAGN|nr:hypothetical protein GIB67_004344 [Kingdonia uniflora]